MRIVMVGGFLGAGKTTTLLAAARRLEASGERVAVITNDQGTDLVDSRLAELAAPAATAEVTGGCFCCRFDDLASTITQVAPGTTVVLAEAVGSCTDLQSTVIRPLRHFYGDDLEVAPLTVLVDPARYAVLSRNWLPLADEPDLAYLYRHQLDEADSIVINKVDTLPLVEVEQLRAELGERFPGARIHAMSAATGDGLDGLLRTWAGAGAGAGADAGLGGRRAFAVDYDRYGAAEAELAWANQTFQLRSEAALAPVAWVERLLTGMGQAGARVGHVKVLVETPDGVTKASLTGAGAPTYDHRQLGPAQEGTVTINARVQVAPHELTSLLDRSIAAADEQVAARSGPRSGQVFQPGFPVPVHRM
ncbi:MAG TPA: GTP-binding protein [Jatrophihabitantaceae bacterium]